MGEIIRAGSGEGVEVARVAVHQLTTVLCLSALAVIIAVPCLLLNTMVIFAAYLLPASAFWVMVCFVMITALITAMFVLLALPTFCSSALSARHVTLRSRSGNQYTEPLCDTGVTVFFLSCGSNFRTAEMAKGYCQLPYSSGKMAMFADYRKVCPTVYIFW